MTVNNVAPTADLANNGPVNEGSPATVTLLEPVRSVARPTRRPASTTRTAATNGAWPARPTPAPDERSATTCTFTDNGRPTRCGRGSSTRTTASPSTRPPSTSNNVAPTATCANNGPVDEGSPATVTLLEPVRPVARPTRAPASTTTLQRRRLRPAGRPATPRPERQPRLHVRRRRHHTVRARIIDKDDGFSSYTSDVTVHNVAPTATLSNNGPIDEGSPATVSFSNQLDPCPADTTAGFHYAYSCANGSPDAARPTPRSSSASSRLHLRRQRQPHGAGADHRQGQRLHRVHDDRRSGRPRSVDHDHEDGGADCHRRAVRECPLHDRHHEHERGHGSSHHPHAER